MLCIALCGVEISSCTPGVPIQVFRDECLKRWKFTETDVICDYQFGCGYPSGIYMYGVLPSPFKKSILSLV